MKELTPMQLDAIAESGNISMGSAATALSNLLGQKVGITTPRLTYTTVGKVRAKYPLPCVLVRVNYTKGLSGSNLFVLTDRDAGVIANMMMGDPDLPVPETLDEMYLSAVSEAMNQMMGSSATALADMFGRPIDITPPELEYIDLGNEQVGINGLGDETSMIEVAFDLTVGEYISSTMLQLLPPDFAEQMVAELFGSVGISEETESVAEAVVEAVDTSQKPEHGDTLNMEPLEEDAISEIGNISMGAAATALSMLLDKRVTITTPRVSITTFQEVRDQFPVPCVVVKVRYRSGLEGDNVLIIREHDAAVIGNLMMGDPDLPVPETLDEIYLSAVSEAMNQMIGSSATALSDMFNRPVDISPPETEYRDLGGENIKIDKLIEEDPLVQISFRMEVAGIIDSELIQLVPLNFAREMIKELLSAIHGSVAVPATVEAKMEAVAEPKPFPIPAPVPAPVAAPFPVEPEQATMMEGAACEILQGVQIDLIRDIPVQITGLLGSRTLPLKILMEMAAGYVVDLNCVADTPLDVLANGKLVARGEIVLVNDQFGVKITEIIQPWSFN
ncbi:MAG: flagellar motor switch phosphatase FliY [Clostridiales bacterium]|nr:flagellar motor switch phosphatase FliY [Clostridiales bacterium]